MNASLLSSPTEISAIDWPQALESNRRWLNTVVRARVADEHAVEDLMQEIVLAVLGQPARPIEAVKVAPWLYRIALRKVVNHRRQQGRQKRLMANYGQSGLPNEVDGSPESWLLRIESDQQIQSCLKKVADSDRELLLLKYTENWGYRELADHLGVSVKTIEYRLLRARTALRRQLTELSMPTERELKNEDD